MFHKLILPLILLIFCFSPLFGFGKYVVLPMEKSVYQRNIKNVGAVRVSLQNLNQFKAIRLKVNDLESQWSLETLIDLKAGKNKLDTTIQLQGGWYSFGFEFLDEIEVKALEKIDHVGVGEVFLVAGQSNAQMEGPAPVDDRVVAALFDGGREGRPDFISLNTTEYKRWVWPSPPGTSFLGSLGDSLVSRLKVPVLFFNAAAGGTSTGDWWTSAVYNEPPYFYVDYMLHKFTFDLGLRGVLWMQGESNSVNPGYNATSEIYRDEVFYMVQKMRDTLDFQQLSWVISLTSWNKAGADPEAGIDPNPWELRKPTRDGQMLLVESDPDIFLGPDTDILEGLANSTLRSDGTHFTQEGFVLAGVLWNRALSDDYFTQSVPYTGKFFKSQEVENQKRDQKVVFKDWNLPLNCNWTALPKASEIDLPVSFSLTKDSPAEIIGDSIRLSGYEGIVGLVFGNNGDEEFNRLQDTLFYEVPKLIGTPIKLSEPTDYVEGEVISLEAQCDAGQVFWRDSEGFETANTSIDLVYQQPTQIFVFCRKESCLSTTKVLFNLEGTECLNKENSQFSREEYVLLDNMLKKIETLDKPDIIDLILKNNLQKKIYLHQSIDQKITLSFNRCKTE
ncbi:sialate O-acetylesterase [Jiulongibacter sediminis]|uniref:sialate O-acetylesterase n=1 Tax=Jiulongibacter sediminis TaxID=1605367 RepID=UPI0026EF11B3|nr:sialate O-acetylesterase [Jiulongibacter sediminis]